MQSWLQVKRQSEYEALAVIITMKHFNCKREVVEGVEAKDGRSTLILIQDLSFPLWNR